VADHRVTATIIQHCRVFETPEDLAREVADWIVEEALRHQRRFSVCLSGGSTPKRLYELLGAAPRRARFPWERTHWFWGDERFVPHNDPRSNFRMAEEAMLQRVPSPTENIHAIPTEGMPPEACAAAYEAVLKSWYGAQALDPQRPLFDLTLLGLGEDGHIASLFPESPNLSEGNRWVVAVAGAGRTERITLTYPALESSGVTVFLVAGERKRDILLRVAADDPALPATRLRPTGAIYWFADRAADPLGRPSPLGDEESEQTLARK